MASDRLRRSKRTVLTVASAIGNAEFRRQDFSVAGFCNDVLKPTDSEIDAAVKIAEHFCIPEGCFNNFFPGVRLLVGFLLEYSPGLPDDVQTRAFRDLRHILEKEPTSAAIRGWIESHFNP